MQGDSLQKKTLNNLTNAFNFLKLAFTTLIILIVFFYVPQKISKTIAAKRNKETLKRIRSASSNMSVNRGDLINCLKMINDPEFNENIVDLGIVKEVNLDKENNVLVIIRLYYQCPYRMEMYLLIKESLKQIKGIGNVRVKIENTDSLDHLNVYKDSNRTGAKEGRLQ